MGQVTAVILAAGHGTRMRSDLVKVMHPIGGKPMVGHVVDNCRQAGVGRLIVVVGYQKEKVQQYLGDTVEYAVQEPQLGTAHAVMQARPLLAGEEGDLLVILGDNPFIGPDVIERFLATHRESGAEASLLSAITDDPGMLGRIIRNPDGSLDQVVEYKDATPEQRAIQEVNSGIFLFRLPSFWDFLSQVENNNVQKEYYLPGVIPYIRAAGGKVEAVPAATAEDVLAPNDRKQLAEAEAVLRHRILDRLMESGVSIIDPATTWVDAQATIGRDTVLYPFTFIQGKTVIGANCTIGPNARLVDAIVADGVRIEMSVVEESRIGESCRIGPFAHVRPGCDLGPGCEIGNYAELKNTRTGQGMKMHHHSYLGDAVIGDHVNIGAGVITCNYDGFQKHQTVVGDGAFIGTNVNLIAPITVGQNAYVAAGSTVSKPVPADALAISRPEQVIKEGYVSRMRGLKAKAPTGKDVPPSTQNGE